MQNKEQEAPKWRAVVFDMDGVVTDTASMHAAAWKEMFDDYLESLNQRENTTHRPFDIDQDYRQYVDGKPREDGVSDFLKSRDISLEHGNADDAADTETVCGLGNRKNALFRARMRQDGVRTYEDVVQVIRDLRATGVKTAIISASKNCADVLAAGGIDNLFDVRVDGLLREEWNLKGKPAPDILLKAVALLDVHPSEAVVVEDARAGVEAGRAGGFVYVIGIDRHGEACQLKEHGADAAACDGRELENLLHINRRTTDDLPHILSHWEDFEQELTNKMPALFLDFDGTLTPIVERPDQAKLSDAMKTALTQLANLYPVAIVSGRGLADVQERVGIETLYYAGSHGLELCGPHGEPIQNEVGREALPDLDAAEQHLRDVLQNVAGAEVERKRFSLAIHYRRVAENQEDDVEDAVDEVLRKCPALRKKHGKQVFELQPDVEWDKGRAVQRLLEELDAPGHETILPIYIGDDVTDRDAFRTLTSSGVGIIVHADDPKPTRAQYRLADPSEVHAFLVRLTER